MVATIYLVAGLLVAPVLMYRLASFLHVFLNNLKPMKISEVGRLGYPLARHC